MGNNNEYNANISNEIFTQIGEFNPKIKSNNKYLGTFSDSMIKIFNLNPQDFSLTLDKSFRCNNKINYLDFNPDYPEILMSALDDGDVKLWNISNQENYNKEISIFKGHSSSARFALFNPTESKIVVSSDNNNIKLWDINQYSHEYNIIHKNNIDKLKWNYSGDKYGYINKGCELIVNKKDNNIDLFTIKYKDKYKNNYFYIKDFIFKGERGIITFHDDRINIWDMTNTIEPINTYYTKFFKYLYDKNLNYFYAIGFNKIDIYKPNDFTNKIQELELLNLPRSINLVLLDSCFLKSNEIANILEINEISSRTIKITQKNRVNYPEIKIQPKLKLNEYLSKIVYQISDYSELLKYNNNVENKEIIIKQRYVNIPQISSEFKSLQNQSLLERKEYVKKEVNEVDKIESLKQKYISYLKLLLRDNTNKELIKKYLAFLKENKNKIIISSDVDYNSELKYYIVCLSKSDLKQLNENKENSEFDNLIHFLNKLYEVKNFFQFANIKKDDIKELNSYSYFNQPIEVDNIELYFYKIKMNLYYKINKMDLDDFIAQFEFKKTFIKKVLDNNIFNNKEIIKNEELLNLVTFCIININDKNSETYNEFLDLTLSNNKINKYYQMSEEMKSEINIADIKKFLHNILKASIIKNLINFLYGNDHSSKFIDKYINSFIDNFLNFVPFKGVDSSGMTDRFSLKTYIFMDQQIDDLKISNQSDKEQITKALKIGRAIIIILHELCHNFYSYILENYNYNNLPFETPKKEFLKIQEGGFYAELVLFGRIVNEINLEEILYILNEANYMKDNLKTFQKDFINITDDKEIYGIYSGFNKIRKSKNYTNYKNISINTKPKFVEKSSKNPSSIKIRMNGNCVVGSNRKINVDLINNFFKKYHRIED